MTSLEQPLIKQVPFVYILSNSEYKLIIILTNTIFNCFIIKRKGKYEFILIKWQASNIRSLLIYYINIIIISFIVMFNYEILHTKVLYIMLCVCVILSNFSFCYFSIYYITFI